jgi:hypothetical protein
MRIRRGSSRWACDHFGIRMAIIDYGERVPAACQLPLLLLDGFFFLREGPRSQGASWGVCGSRRYGRTAIRFFKFVWCFRQQVFHKFSLRNGSN